MNSKRFFLLAGLAFGACANNTQPTGPAVTLAIAPLSLPGVKDACYTLEVANDLGETVWRQKNICSSRYGDGIGDVTYVGPCDAQDNDTPADGTAMNTVTLTLENLYDAPATPTDYALGAIDDTTWTNPCSRYRDGSLVTPNGDGHGPCQLSFDCKANADVFVAFDVTVMRSAQQGFFDIAVNLEDIFCSAKLDTCYDLDTPITLLHGPDGQRGPTAVLALACTAGPGRNIDSTLHLSSLVIDCPGAFKDIALDPSVGPGNAFSLGTPTSDPYPTDAVYQYAVYEGSEGLGCGTSCSQADMILAYQKHREGVGAELALSAEAFAAVGRCDLHCVRQYSTWATSAGDDFVPFSSAWADVNCEPVADCNKIYWNIAIGLDPSVMPAGCLVRASATASDGGFADGDGEVTGTVPTGTAYPVITFASQLTTEAGLLDCVQDGLDDGAGVTTTYTGGGSTFCYYGDGDLTDPVDDTIYQAYANRLGPLALSYAEFCARPFSAGCVERYIALADRIDVSSGVVPMTVHEYCDWGGPCVDAYLEYAKVEQLAERTPAPFDQAWIDVHCTAVTGQVVLESEEDQLLPVAFARIVATPTTGAARPIEVMTDGGGFYQVPTFPADIQEVRIDTYIDGALAGSELVPLVATPGGTGKDVVVDRSIIGIAIAACVGYQWWQGAKVTPPASTPNNLKDKFRHCYASCRAARNCSVPAAWAAGMLKELLDELCEDGPNWLKKLLKKVSACGGWDAGDVLANNRGISCTRPPLSVTSNSGCYTCCDTWY